jgi:hypothetical protein
MRDEGRKVIILPERIFLPLSYEVKANILYLS